MTEIAHLNELEYDDADEKKIKVQLHDGKLYSQVRDDSTGDFNTPRSIQNKDILIIKDMYGGNGNDRNLCLKFQLKFADVQAYQISHIYKQELYKVITAQEINDSLVAEMIFDTSAGNINSVSITYTVAYNPNNQVVNKTKALALLMLLQNQTNLSNLFSTVPAPFNTNVTLQVGDITPMILHKNVPASIMNVVVTDTGYNSTQFTLTLVGNWDHWAVKYDTSVVIQSDNEYVRIKDGTLSYNYTGLVYTTITKIYITLFDRDYQPLYSYECSNAPFTLSTALRRSLKTNYY